MVTTFSPELTDAPDSFVLTGGTFTTAEPSPEDQRIFLSQPSDDVYDTAVSRLVSGNAYTIPARAVLDLND